jgi:hypothetical protein
MLEVDLSRCRIEQVGSTHDMRDALRGVIDHNRKLIGP